MDDITRYTCTQCGIVVRVEGDQDHRACACGAGWTVEDESIVEPPAEPPPENPGGE